jgi:hypothetical protein
VTDHGFLHLSEAGYARTRPRDGGTAWWLRARDEGVGVPKGLLAWKRLGAGQSDVIGQGTE